ncbi:M48 family metallopeptidase [Candidatus Thioglobus sp.]|jgi:STE24 endopeptidase|uniref:M48 family metallopeptidase n=1 Tax=Candidatus Thioglobus sp. TaxID=2026721 RepID=UPI001D986208|nr:M48 family metallopeptidase [Candidatus Thioglobus sp.]MBT3277645.1 M48 family metallopeptidase [Candidatus Thioglobus sp.]MBT3447009.1 M48 family metallopeptidase [Candidatus Thioglobus sp.]MBT3744673.1 M48 family metallopeptidase [Candidatus Thioglobus sp.]MBT4001222.1 M48 family metallopeptidase [Candidatus Thioglobus sp.]MBT4181512.1 M48 family metallopeptidase [Candidatus Thioglobus sp.]
MEFNTFTLIFLIAILGYVITLLWLNMRQDKAVANSFDAVPNEFNEKITLADHQKAAEYTQAKLLVNHFEIIFSTVVLLVWTLGGGLNWLDTLWQAQTDNTIYIGVGFIISLMIIGSLIDLPFSIYRTFVLEQKFGFNKMTAGTFAGDLGKEILLTLIIGLPLIYAVLYLMGAMGEYWWAYVWLVLTGFSLLMFWLYPTYIAPIFNKFKPLDNLELKAKIDNLLTRTGFKSDGVFVMDGSKRSSHGNAYFTGIGKNKRIVFFDTLLEGMEDQEVEAILAHELGHFHHKHIRKHMVSTFTISLLGLALLGYLITQEWFFDGLGVSTVSNHAALILFTLALPVFSFFIAPISNALSRKHEFEADAFAAKHTNADDLVSSLVKLYRDNAATLTPDKLYSAFHDSHPSASIRIAELKRHA